jgi:hypothetical protein
VAQEVEWLLCKLKGSPEFNPLLPPKKKKKSLVLVAHAVIIAIQEAEIRKTEVQTLSRKHPTQKRAAGVAQVVESLPSKCEALGSNPHTAKKKKKILCLDV